MLRNVWTAFCISLALLPTGCRQREAQPTQPSVALKPAPATPIAEKKEELGGTTWDQQWDVIIEQALSPDMLSATAAHAVAGYCPRFATEPEADKRAFWAYVFQALAGAEAGLDPTINVRHTQAEIARIDKVTKRPVRQQGLLQLTYDDAERYGCDFNWSKDKSLAEHDPNRTILQPATISAAASTSWRTRSSGSISRWSCEAATGPPSIPAQRATGSSPNRWPTFPRPAASEL